MKRHIKGGGKSMKMMMKRIIYILAFLIHSIAFGLDLEPISTIGSPFTKVTASNVKEAWNGCVEFIIWSDSDTIVYAKKNGLLKCYSISHKAEQWTQESKIKVLDLALGSSFLFVLGEDKNIHTFNLADGKLEETLTQKQLTAIVGSEYWSPAKITTIPSTNQIVVANSTKEYSDNTYLLDVKPLKLLGKLKSEGFVYEIHISSTGGHVVTTTSNNIRVWDLSQKREIFHLGDHKSIPIDAPFISDAMFDGGGILIYSIDNSWSTGTIHVYNIVKDKDVYTFDSLNGHLAMDVDWKRKRIALTGLSRHLYVVDFAGNVLAVLKNASEERIMVVKFSPDGSKIAFGGLDNTVRVFSLKETNADHEKRTDGGNTPIKD